MSKIQGSPKAFHMAKTVYLYTEHEIFFLRVEETVRMDDKICGDHTVCPP